MSIDLPPVIATFIQAKNDYDSAAFAACFTDDAVVHDDGRDIRGVEAIEAWNRHNNAAYQTTADVTQWVQEGNEIDLTASVSGTFDGSPIQFNYHFTLGRDDGDNGDSRDKIRTLSIHA